MCPHNHITSLNVTFGAHCVVHCCVMCCLVIAFLWLHIFALFCTYLQFFAFFLHCIFWIVHLHFPPPPLPRLGSE